MKVRERMNENVRELEKGEERTNQGLIRKKCFFFFIETKNK